jgi:hypothetical protein
MMKRKSPTAPAASFHRDTPVESFDFFSRRSFRGSASVLRRRRGRPATNVYFGIVLRGARLA